MKSKTNETAFPAFPMMDNLGQAVTPFPGMTKLEYFSLHIFLTTLSSTVTLHICNDQIINKAENLINDIEKYQQKLNKTNDTALKIIQ